MGSQMAEEHGASPVANVSFIRRGQGQRLEPEARANWTRTNMQYVLFTNQTAVIRHEYNNTGDYNYTQEKQNSDFEHIPKYDGPVTAFICFVLIILILITILGNTCVIFAVLRERSLRGVSNYLILSLAVTDLMVAIVVMPLSLINEMSENWYLGNEICDFWISVDVLCCTASILHLVAISLDRFWGVSNIDYIRRRCARQIVIMIVIVWIVSFGISIPPLFGWKDPGNAPEIQGVCKISQDWGYTLFSTIGAFYCPLVLMVYLNCKIYRAARSRIRKHKFNSKTKIEATRNDEDLKIMGISFSNEEHMYSVCNHPPISVPSVIKEESNIQGEKSEVVPNGREFLKLSLTPSADTHYLSSVATASQGPAARMPAYTDIVTVNHVVLSARFMEHRNNKRKYKTLKRKMKQRDVEKKRKDKMDMKRERKAAKVLGIITGSFVGCWLPFFILAVLIPFCGQFCAVPSVVKSICLWLGYCNSSLNPVLYTIFNPAFRKAFYKLLGTKCKREPVLRLRRKEAL